MNMSAAKKRGLLGTLFSRLLHSYFLIARGLTLGVRAVVRSESGDILLVRHTYTPGWHFPGGGVETGESCIDALKNELRQEAGLELAGEPTFLGLYFNKGISKRDHVLLYDCEVTGDIANRASNFEIAEVRFFQVDALPDDIEPGTRKRINEIVHGAAISETWS